MRLSQYFFSTSKNSPGDAELVSHQLMIRCGMIRSVASGLYAFLPLGFRVLRKVIAIVEDEMNRVGAQELLLPFVQPAELWKRSGRWDQYGEELVRFQDRKGSWFVLSPTHEEVITHIASDILTSYRRLPVTVYQTQIKFRDEPRPRGGVIRSREFIMKDAYSFCEDEDQMSPIYEAMKQAYANIFSRCGLEYRMVEADSDLIGGDLSHEFIVLAEGGEGRIVECTHCGYVAMLGKAVSKLPEQAGNEMVEESLAEIHTPEVGTIESLSQFLSLPATRFLKTLVYVAGEEYVAVVIRGDYEVNEAKCKRLLGVDSLRLASASEILACVGVPVGYLGPFGLGNMRLVVDEVVMTGRDFVAGATKPGKHVVHVDPTRDFLASLVGDLRMVKSGDPCPHCGNPLETRRGLEAGHLFHLGDKYSDKLQATFLDETGTSRHLVMGCYGIGISRLPAAIIEQNYDEDGIVWPQEIAPFPAVIIPVSESTIESSLELYDSLCGQIPDILIDDRNVSAGVKFKDSDLMGIPYKIIVGKSFLHDQTIEIKCRSDREIIRVKPHVVGQKLRELIGRCKTEN